MQRITGPLFRFLPVTWQARLTLAGLILWFFGVGLPLHAQDRIQLLEDRMGDTLVVRAINREFCPVTLVPELQLTNLEQLPPFGQTILLPVDTQPRTVFRFIPVTNTKPARYQLSFRSFFGDTGQEHFDTAYAYHLPYSRGSAYKIGQGYNGHFSHRDENSLDFDMPLGTPILAIREGVVVRVVQNHDRSCPDPKCKDFNNLVVVYHPDGSFAEYGHIQRNGARVVEGQKIRKGEVIALSGKTGYSSGPHLHLMVFLPGMTRNRSLQTLFLTGDGQKGILLEEGKTYQRAY